MVAFLKKCTFYLLNPSLTWTPLCGNQRPWPAPIHPPHRSLPSSEPLLANFKEFTSKAFGRHRTARLRLEFPALAEGVEPSSLFLLFTQAAFLGDMEAAFTPHLSCAARGEAPVKGRYLQLWQNKGTSSSAMERDSILALHLP